jgi:hypothetical protein
VIFRRCADLHPLAQIPYINGNVSLADQEYLLLFVEQLGILHGVAEDGNAHIERFKFLHVRRQAGVDWERVIVP